ncbi:MAG: RNA polymerase sigma factor [Proteobacteria bacterium]|nr:RNA polymerase sigma factor [Pseudomonadota bacterium]
MQTDAPIAAMVMPTPVVRDAPRSAAMAAVKAGDRDAFRAVVEHHERDLLSFCLRYTGDLNLARDLAQEVFLTLWKEREHYDERGKLRFYLLRMARLRCLAALKKRRSQARLAVRYAREHAGSSVEWQPDEVSLHAGDAARLIRAGLARLKPEHAELLVLRHLEGMDLNRIAELTGLRIGTIKSRLSRGLTALRKELAHVR